MANSSSDIKNFFLQEGNKVPQYLKQLSKDLYEMYVKRKNTDITLRTGNNQNISCHRAILAIRSPFFSQMIDLIEDNHSNEFDLSTIKEKTIKPVLDYIYSADLRLIAFQEVSFSDLYDTAHGYELFAMKDFLGPQILPEKPPVDVNEMNFIWKIEEVERSGLFSNCIWETSYPKAINIGPDKFYIRIKGKGSSPDKGYITVYLRRDTDREVIHQVSLDVAILDTSKRRNFLRRLDYIFRKNGECYLRVFVKKEVVAANKHIFLKNDTLVFDFTFEVRFYDFEPQVQETAKVFKLTDREKCSKALMNSYQVLSNDLLRLFWSRQRCDLILLSDGGNLFVHTCILAARSAMEISLLKSLILKLSLDEAVSFILFQYTADSKYLRKHAEKVHKISINLKLDNLTLFYSHYLSTTLTIDNVLDRLVDADLYKDVNLIENSVDFIYLNVDTIFLSENWRTFFEQNQELASEVLNYIEGKQKDPSPS